MINKNLIILDSNAKTQNEVLLEIANKALEQKVVSSSEQLYDALVEREAISTTAFEDGIAIPHAHINTIKEATIIFIRTKNKLNWVALDGSKVNVVIALLVPQGEQDSQYINILANLSRKLLDSNFRQFIKEETNIKLLIEKLLEQKDEVENINLESNNISIVAITACATGVAHTYMARDALIAAAGKLNWNIFVETQGQKGQEYKLTSEQIDKADAVLIATDIVVDKERFINKKILQVPTNQAIHNGKDTLLKTISKSKKYVLENQSSNIFDIKGGRDWIKNIMSGVSFMIPFVVFAGITFAVVTGLGKIIWGEKLLDYSGTWNAITHTYTQLNPDPSGNNIIINGLAIRFMMLLNNIASIGFTIMMPIMGMYIAYGIAGRAAMAPALILTWVANDPGMWFVYGPFEEFSDKMKGLSIFGALIFGFAVGYLVKWINNKWKINKYIQPIMPIIIIPVFITLILAIIWITLIGNIFGIAIGYLYEGLNALETSGVGMALVGLLLGLIAGVDMGGPINKIASFSATALIYEDMGRAMGAAAAAFAIAPLGAGLATMIFRNRFKEERALGVNATILGFMGISEGAIPFAVKYTWAAIIPNIICSGIAGMFAGIFGVSGWVGAWGGPIIALFGGVTSGGSDMSYLGILYYLIAIAIGTVCHIILFRILVEIRDKKQTGEKIELVKIFKKNQKNHDLNPQIKFRTNKPGNNFRIFIRNI